MNTHSFIDCDVMLGMPEDPDSLDVAPTVDDLEACMDRLQVQRAVVRHRACLTAAPADGNDILFETVADHPRLQPCPFVSPRGREPHFQPAACVADWVAAGCRVVWTDPSRGDYSFRPWAGGRLFAALAAHRLPLWLPFPSVAMDDVYAVLTAYPDLRLILARLPRRGRIEDVEALLAACPNLYLCLGSSFTVHGGCRALCDRHGPARWVWGTGYPEREPGAAVADLVYAGLDEGTTTAIAGGNAQRLSGEVQA